MQAGAREYPAPPFPKQHQRKPGAESVLNPSPMYDAPFYLGSCKLENKVALITRGDSGIGRSVAILFAREGADAAIVFLITADNLNIEWGRQAEIQRLADNIGREEIKQRAGKLPNTYIRACW